MGTPLDPDEPEFGEDSSCFAAGAAPARVTMIVTGFIAIDNPFCQASGSPNGQVHLVQSEFDSLLYSFETDNFKYAWDANRNGQSEASVFWKLIGRTIFREWGAPCRGGSYDAIGTGAVECWFPGGVSVNFGGSSQNYTLQAYAELLGIPIDNTLNGDHWPWKKPDSSFLFVSHRNNVNIQFSLDVTHYEQYLDLEA